MFKYAGFISAEGSLGGTDAEKHSPLAGKLTGDRLAIITYWQSFEQREQSHANETFKNILRPVIT